MSEVDRWLAGWLRVRGYAAGTAPDGVVTVEVHDGHRELELLVPDADVDGRRLDRACQEALALRGAWLTAVTTQPGHLADRLAEHGLRVLAPSECLMRRRLAEHPAPPAPPGHRLAVDRDDPDAPRVRLYAPDDRLAASGQAGVVGHDVVLDRILTEPDHRRRGLASVVVGALVGAAAERGATHGLLVASPEGHALYGALGWERVADVVIGTPH